METAVQTPGKKHPPDCKFLVFTLNPETKYYQMTTGEMGFYKVPNELKLEITQRPEIIKSGVIIQSRIVNGKRQFFTGLLKTRFDSWYFGDHFEVRHGIKKNSFILFHFREDQAVFEMFFFNLIKIYPDHRERFISDFLNSLKKINGAENSHPVHLFKPLRQAMSERKDKDTTTAGNLIANKRLND